MAHKKAGGSTVLGRDSAAKRLGVKIHGGEVAHSGEIIIRQRGTKFHPGKNVAKGSDDTLYAKKNGKVRFFSKKVRGFSNSYKERRFVEVLESTK